MTLTLKQIDGNITKVRGIGANANKLIQDTAVAIIAHGKEHGDVTRALLLVQAMPSTMRREMLVNWFGHYGPIGMNTKEGKVKLIDTKSKRWRQWDVDGAKANPWFVPESVPANLRPEPIPNTMLEFNVSIVRFLTRMEKQAEDPKLFNAEQKDDALALVEHLRDITMRTAKGDEVARLKQQYEQAQADLTAYGDTYERRPQTGEITSATTGDKVGKVQPPEGTGAVVQHGNRKTRQQGQRSSAKADANADKVTQDA